MIWRGIRALVCGADDGAPAPGISQVHDSRVNVGAIAAEGRRSFWVPKAHLVRVVARPGDLVGLYPVSDA